MIKKILVRLYYLRRCWWKRFQAADFSFEVDRFLLARKNRQMVKRIIKKDTAAWHLPKRSEISFSYQKRQARFWLPFSVVATVALLYPISPLLKHALTTAQAQPAASEAILVEYESSLDELLNNDPTKRLPSIDLRENNIDFTPKLIIEKIGVEAEIIESDEAHLALNQGVWRMPISSTPDKGGNTVLTAHRYKFLPPSKKTFYLLDKLVIGDAITVNWQGKKFIYQVSEIKIITPKEVSILKNSPEPILTLFTCTPLFSNKDRLVVIAKLVEIE